MADNFLAASFRLITRHDAAKLGLKRYFTGKPCEHGHVVERYVINQRCLECLRTGTARWRSANYDQACEGRRKYIAKARAADPEKFRDAVRRWYARHRDSQNAKIRKDRAVNPEKYRAKDRTRYLRRREKVRTSSRQYYLNNAERVKKRSRQYARNNPERRKAHEYKRRALKRKSGGVFTVEDIDRIRKEQRNCCAYYRVCGTKNPTQIDHIIPLSRGGTNHASNIQLTCRACNMSKHAKHPIEFAKELGMLL
jgi:5-methylcytosine-specific restriction endonuclease McrA